LDQNENAVTVQLFKEEGVGYRDGKLKNDASKFIDRVATCESQRMKAEPQYPWVPIAVHSPVKLSISCMRMAHRIWEYPRGASGVRGPACIDIADRFYTFPGKKLLATEMLLKISPHEKRQPRSLPEPARHQHQPATGSAQQLFRCGVYS
jgi:hypothetical protein